PTRVQPRTARGRTARIGALPSKPLRSFPFLHREAPEHHVERLHVVDSEALISIARVDPELPVFLTPALVGDVIDLGEKRGAAAAGIAEAYSMRAALGRVHHIEHRGALCPGKGR